MLPVNLVNLVFRFIRHFIETIIYTKSSVSFHVFNLSLVTKIGVVSVSLF